MKLWIRKRDIINVGIGSIVSVAIYMYTNFYAFPWLEWCIW